MNSVLHQFSVACIIAITLACNSVNTESHPVLCSVIPSRSALAKTNFAAPVSKNKPDSQMVWIRGGHFTMGSNEFIDAQPLHEVSVKGFWMDVHEVTNKQFAAFVKATGYITVAERKLNPEK